MVHSHALYVFMMNILLTTDTRTGKIEITINILLTTDTGYIKITTA